MVAFSRSSRPIEPISWLSETCTSPSSRLTISAAASSCRRETGANTLVIATPSAVPPTSPRKRAMASVSSGDRSRPSNSMPPSTIVSPTETASAQVARPPEHRPDAVGGRAADPEHCHPAQPAALQDGVRRVGRAEHDVGDPVAARPWAPAARSSMRGDDAAGHVRRAGHLGLGEHAVGGVHDHRVGVGAPDVDAEAAVRPWHRRAPPRAGSRSRSRTTAARRPRCRARSARSGRRGTR